MIFSLHLYFQLELILADYADQQGKHGPEGETPGAEAANEHGKGNGLKVEAEETGVKGSSKEQLSRMRLLTYDGNDSAAQILSPAVLIADVRELHNAMNLHLKQLRLLWRVASPR